MNRPHFRRHPRPIDPNPEYSRLDRLDGLPRAHRAPCTDGDVCGEPAHCPPEPNPRLAWLAEQHRRLDDLRVLYAKPLRAAGGVITTGGTVILDEDDRIRPLDAPGTRYDDQWPDVLAAEAGGWAGGDLPAIPPVPWADLVTHDTTCEAEVGGDLAAMAAPGDWPVWDYGEGYEIEPEERASSEPGLVWVRLAADVSRFTEAMARCQAALAPVKPHGRHRQTALGLLLADLRDIENRLS